VELSSKAEEALGELTICVMQMGYRNFDEYFSSHLSFSLKEMARDLGVSYNSFAIFCREYYQHQKMVGTPFSEEDFVRLFGGGERE